MAVAIRASRQSNNGASGATSLTLNMPGPLTIALRGSPLAGGLAAAGTSVAATYPAGVTIGDVLVIEVTVAGGSGITISPPTANGTWALLGRVNSTTALGQGLYWKVATAGDVSTGSATFTITSAKASWTCMALQNASATQPTSTYIRGQANASSLTITVPASGTITAGNGIDVCMTGYLRNGMTVGTNASYTNDNNAASSGGSASANTTSHVSHRALTPSGTSIASFTEVWTGTAAVNIGQAVFIQQVAAAPTAVDGDVLLAGISDASAGSGVRVSAPTAWSADTHPFTVGVESLDYANGVWTAGDISGNLATSSNGVSWTLNPGSPFTGSPEFTRIKYINGIWYALGGSPAKIYTASDPTSTWTAQTNSLGATYAYCIGYGNGLYVVGSFNGQIATSPDGSVWTNQSAPSNLAGGTISEVFWTGIEWVLYSDAGWATSDDPTTGVWTVATKSGFSLYTPRRGLALNGSWYATGNGATLLRTDNRGASWTSVLNVTLTGQVTMIADQLVVADGSAGIYSSYDGLAWSWQGIPSGSMSAIAGNPSGQVVVVSQTTPKVLTAPSLGSGWRPIARDVNASLLAFALYWKIASSEPSSYVFPLTSSNTPAIGTVIALSGASPGPPVRAAVGEADSSDTTTSIVAPATGTFSAMNGLDIAFFSTEVATTISAPTSPSPYTELYDSSNGALTQEVCTLAYTGATTIGSITATAGSGAANLGEHVFIVEPSFVPSRPVASTPSVRRAATW